MPATTRSSLERLQDRLDKDISWRKKEISALRASSANDQESRKHIYRAGLVMLCAHWEGFLRCSLQFYLEHVFSHRLSIKDLAPEFVAIYYFQDVIKAASAKSPGTEQHHLRLAKRILEGNDIKCTKPSWKVETGANPSSIVTSALLIDLGLDKQLGLDGAAWTTTKVFIDEQILKVRNQVAHGEGRLVNHDEFTEASERVVAMCDKLSSLIICAATKKTYRSRN